ncbi:chromosome segregation protein SMC [bacterium]|nr:chromosome segregation protein SMC [bacterium]
MRLKSIEIQGFKSFVDRTRLEFDEGITAILGPNGCGKSNVVDAVRWVLGEQSAKTLRGGKMDDVIFKGTTKRRPVGMAEVTLTFENDDRGLPIDFAEVAIKRKVTRDGGSDYFLNGSPCRLKDLRDLFFDSGVNNTSYSIIEESMIKSILNENNTELRTLLEEGSGITKYKARRKETQRKLDRTQSDLVRLYDIIEEIGREVRSLQRQVGKARRHQRLFKEIRALDLAVAQRKHQLFDSQEAEARERLEDFRTRSEEGVGELAELQARIETARPTIDEREAERRQLESALQAFEEELQETERQALVLQHRIDEHARRVTDSEQGIREAEVRQQEIEGQIARMTEHLHTIEAELETSGAMLTERSEELQIMEGNLARDREALDDATSRNLEVIENDASQRSQLRELQVKQENRNERMGILAEDREAVLASGREAEGRLAELRGERESVLAERAGLLEELAAREREQSDLEAATGDIQAQLSDLNGKREAARSTCDLLRKLHQEYEGYGQGPKEILKRHGGTDRVTGGLADLLSVAPGDAPALEILLDEMLDAVVVKDGATAVALVRELREEEIGQASFLCGEGFGGGGAETATITGGRPGAEVITGPGADLPALRNLLARTVIFDDDQAAADAAAGWSGPGVVLCVSRTGLLVTSEGRVRGGRGADQASTLIGRREKLEEIEAEIAAVEARIEATGGKLAANRARREELRETLAAGRGRLAGVDERISGLTVELGNLEHRRDTAGARAEEMENERRRLAAEVAELAGRERNLTDLLAESGRAREDSTTRRDDLRRRVEEAEMSRDDARAQVEELRLTHQRRESQKRETETALVHLRENVAEQFARRERLAQEIEVARDNKDSLAEELEVKRGVLAKGMDERERRRKVVRAASEGIATLHEEMSAWRDRVQVIEKARGGFREQAHEMETLLATLDIKRNNLEERVEEQYKGSYHELVTNFDAADLPGELEVDEGVFQLEQAEQILDDKRDKIGALGPINHLALEEYETKKERLDFLEKQRDDVEKARDDLTRAIAEINRTAKKRFVETFEEVRRNYIAVFQTLFKGGRAELELVKTDDPLESHIHVTAQPTGKVVDTVSLLSGGERCLTALSLLFAVYLVKPSPFCMLDEADAPLDDANIGRFVNMLREFSRSTQFLVITHNKLTMETANHLYGVTMMEPGCSNIVSVSFHDVAETQSDQDLGNAIANRRKAVDESEDKRAAENRLDDRQTEMTLDGGAAAGDETAGEAVAVEADGTADDAGEGPDQDEAMEASQ